MAKSCSAPGLPVSNCVSLPAVWTHLCLPSLNTHSSKACCHQGLGHHGASSASRANSPAPCWGHPGRDRVRTRDILWCSRAIPCGKRGRESEGTVGLGLPPRAIRAAPEGGARGESVPGQGAPQPEDLGREAGPRWEPPGRLGRGSWLRCCGHC